MGVKTTYFVRFVYGKQEFVTKTIKGTEDPVWGQKFLVEPEEHSKIVWELWEVKGVRDYAMIGRTIITTKEEVVHRDSKYEIPLNDPSGEPLKHENGKRSCLLVQMDISEVKVSENKRKSIAKRDVRKHRRRHRIQSITKVIGEEELVRAKSNHLQRELQLALERVQRENEELKSQLKSQQNHGSTNSPEVKMEDMLRQTLSGISLGQKLQRVVDNKDGGFEIMKALPITMKHGMVDNPLNLPSELEKIDESHLKVDPNLNSTLGRARESSALYRESSRFSDANVIPAKRQTQLVCSENRESTVNPRGNQFQQLSQIPMLPVAMDLVLPSHESNQQKGLNDTERERQTSERVEDLDFNTVRATGPITNILKEFGTDEIASGPKRSVFKVIEQDEFAQGGQSKYQQELQSALQCIEEEIAKLEGQLEHSERRNQELERVENENAELKRQLSATKRKEQALERVDSWNHEFDTTRDKIGNEFGMDAPIPRREKQISKVLGEEEFVQEKPNNMQRKWQFALHRIKRQNKNLKNQLKNTKRKNKQFGQIVKAMLSKVPKSHIQLSDKRKHGEGNHWRLSLSEKQAEREQINAKAHSAKQTWQSHVADLNVRVEKLETAVRKSLGHNQCSTLTRAHAPQFCTRSAQAERKSANLKEVLKTLTKNGLDNLTKKDQLILLFLDD